VSGGPGECPSRRGGACGGIGGCPCPLT
jgi:hypothetical protein